MREKEIENDLVKKAKKRGGIALKFTSPGYDGVPDRLVLLPNSKMGFVEVKAPGKKPRTLQITRMQMLQSLGFKAYVLDDKKDTEVILDEIQTS
ncbi:MAG: VRR-NUC domain-containing protein [Clostridia bacterium]|nr:VRR-NUC domain-containing protein [Clostridia bacterium]